MSFEAAYKDAKSWNPYFHPQLHQSTEPISSRFYRPFMKSTWFSSVTEKMTISSSSDSEVVYKVNPVFHFLFFSYMRVQFPKVEAADSRVQVAWTNEPSTAIVIKASLRQDNIVLQELDDYSIGINNHFYQAEGAGKRDLNRLHSGDTNGMTTWASSHEAVTLNVEHPWYYSTDHASAYPIHFNDEDPRTEHRYEFRRRVGDLLRVRVLQEDGSWKNLKASEITDAHVKGYSVNTLLPIPELWGKYGLISQQELDEIKDGCKPDYKNFWIKDYVSCDPGQILYFGTTVKADIQNDCPCLAAFWSVENRNSHFYNNYCNYTIDCEDPATGFDPLISSKFKYGNTDRIVNSETDHFTASQVRHHFPSAPYKNGYHAYSFAWYSFSNQADIAIVFDSSMKATLECLINEKHTDEEKTEIDAISGGDKTLRFKLKVRLLVYKKLSIAKDSATGRWLFEINKPVSK